MVRGPGPLRSLLNSFSRAVTDVLGDRVMGVYVNRGDSVRSHLSWRDQDQCQPGLAGQAVGIKEVHDDIWLVTFMDYDLGYFDLETRVLEPLDNPFGPKVLPMS